MPAANPTSELSQMRCFNHLHREAVARCPECRRFFCRECVTEHDDRVICAACLKKLVGAKGARKFRLTPIVLMGESILGVLILWMFFYCVGRVLISLPSSFHEGIVWTNDRPAKNQD